MVQYDSDGQVLGQAVAALQTLGFEVGSVIQVMKGKADDQWIIKSMSDDGDVALAKLTRDGVEGVGVTVSINEFAKRFKLSKTRTRAHG
jgi:hypothetical protein